METKKLSVEELKQVIKQEVDKMIKYCCEDGTILVDEVQDCLFMLHGLEVDKENTPEAFAYIEQYLRDLGVYEDSAKYLY